MSVDQLGGIKILDFTGIAKPTVEDARRLGRCLNLCRGLDLLDLQSVELGAEGVEALFSALSGEARIKEIRYAAASRCPSTSCARAPPPPARAPSARLPSVSSR